MPPPFSIRRAGPEDLDTIVALCGRALGWRDGEPNEAFFRWKHLDNAFGPSPMWVAESGGIIVGVRAMMRWEFNDGSAVHRAVRAVDTATDPAWQGRGVFRALTLHAIDDLMAEGVSFIFNTPNAKSRPGYEKMGWSVAGRVPMRFRVRPRAVVSLARVARQRAASEKWSMPLTAGESAIEAFASVAARRDNPPTQSQRLTTVRTSQFLQWRYGFAPLAYRVMHAADDPEAGCVVFRARRRGGAVELVINDAWAQNEATARRLITHACRLTKADYILATDATPGTRHTTLPAPGQGPVLTVRALRNASPTLDDLALRMGDIELF